MGLCRRKSGPIIRAGMGHVLSYRCWVLPKMPAGLPPPRNFPLIDVFFPSQLKVFCLCVYGLFKGVFVLFLLVMAWELECRKQSGLHLPLVG